MKTIKTFMALVVMLFNVSTLTAQASDNTLPVTSTYETAETDFTIE